MPHQAGFHSMLTKLFPTLPDDITRDNRDEKSVTYIVIGTPLRHQLGQDREVGGDQQNAEPGDGRPGYGPGFCGKLLGEFVRNRGHISFQLQHTA